MMDARLDDLVRFYALLNVLEKRLGGKRELTECNGKMSWPRRGVYFFTEKDEERSDTGTGARIVRVGTHALTDGARTTLWKRLSQHRGVARTGGGNHRVSIFRLIVGTALIERDRLDFPTWDSRRSSAPPEIRAAELDMECAVSKEIGAMQFLWLSIDDEPGEDSGRGYIERNTIALLSNFEKEPIDVPSRNWLGHHCNRPRVRSSGLWNSNHVDETYDPALLDRLERYIGEVRCDGRNTHTERIIELLARSPSLNDDEIAKKLRIEPRQTVNQICRRLDSHGVLERSTGSAGKIINTLTGTPTTSGRKPAPSPAPARTPVLGADNALTPERFEKTLLVIPCSKSKVEGSAPRVCNTRLTEKLPSALAAELKEARKNVAQKTLIDESTLMSAWRRYDGSLYRAASGALGDLLSEGMRIIILSGGYGALLAEEPIGDYSAALKPSWWPNRLLQRVLLAYAESQGISSVRAFASATSPYFRVLNSVRWRDAGIEDALLVAPEAQTGGTLKSPASIGEALTALRDRDLYAGWRSSYGLGLDIYGS